MNNTKIHFKWVEKAIKENYIKYYNYAEFKDVQEIYSRSVAKTFRAKWKDTDMVMKYLYKLSIEEV
ncbi:9838_t:CDS:1, partial [Funneliformis caledonium]